MTTHGHGGRVSKIREMEKFRSYNTCSVQYAIIMDMDTDPGSLVVSTLAVWEANRAHFDSETPEEREDHFARRRARRRDGIASETTEERETPLAAGRARRRRRITSESANQR